MDVNIRKNLSRHKSSCRDTKNRKIAEVLLRQGILCRDKKLKSNTERILQHINLCCDIMKNRRQNLCRDRIFSCRDTDYCNLESLLRHRMKKFCRDKVMSVVTLKDKVSSPDKETKLRQVMLT